jgi:hypothetical protein
MRGLVFKLGFSNVFAVLGCDAISPSIRQGNKSLGKKNRNMDRSWVPDQSVYLNANLIELSVSVAS